MTVDFASRNDLETDFKITLRYKPAWGQVILSYTGAVMELSKTFLCASLDFRWHSAMISLPTIMEYV